MASGNTLAVFTPHQNESPASNYATLDTRNNHLVLDFDDTGAEDAIFGGFLARHYTGGGITATLIWMATSATSGNVKWNLAFERHQDDVDDLDTDSFAAAQTVTAAAPSASGESSYDAIAFTNGAQIDNLAAGESFRIKVTRGAADAADTMVGDAELLRMELKET